MNSIKGSILYRFPLLIILFAITPTACFKSLTVTNIVYQNNFESSQLNDLKVYGWNNGLFGQVTQPRISSFNESKVLGMLNSNQIKLNLSNLPAHQSLRVEFDLNLHNKWKNDLWAMQFDGNYRLITGFSTDPGIQQSYPNWIGNGSALSPAGVNSETTSLPGICSLINSPTGSTRYRIVTTIQHTASTFDLDCNDAGGVFNDTCQRGWSMDNLKISVFKN
ncbi:MAG: hypothetical protein HYU71_08750 [Bacteroidetes bacterium]|nr:hypothetical protein [Bacteroidota bacterium]